ncbi:MAG: cytidine deaminase [Akkermansiaceae bacterium]|jgi:cytidine deaminase
MTDLELISRAMEVRANCYAPYSKFPVGAALLGVSGKVYQGVNVENASYGLTICAERVAIGSAVAAGEKAFQKIAIVVKGGGSPCGACRQVLNEFAPDLQVLMADEAGTLIRQACLSDLLPEAFGPHSL